MDIGGSKLKAAEARVNLVQTEIDRLQGVVTKATVAVKTAERSVNGRKLSPAHSTCIRISQCLKCWMDFHHALL